MTSRCALFSGKIYFVSFALSRRRRDYTWWHKRCLTQDDNSFMNNYGTGTASSRRRFLLRTTFSTRQEIWMRGSLQSHSLRNVKRAWRMRSPVCTYFIFLLQSWFSHKYFLFVSLHISYFHVYSLKNIATLWHIIPKIL